MRCWVSDRERVGDRNETVERKEGSDSEVKVKNYPLMKQIKRERIIKHYKTHKEREIQIEKLIENECVCMWERER